MCVEGELYADFFIDEESAAFFEKKPVKLPNAKIVHQAPTLQPEKVICLFYNAKLYGINISNVKGMIATVRSRYIEVFGKPISMTDFGTGVSEIVWEDATTYLMVSYSTEEKGTDELDIKYTDKKIAAKIPHEE